MAGNRNDDLILFIILNFILLVMCIAWFSESSKFSEKELYYEKALNDSKELINEMKKSYAEKEELFKKIEKLYQNKVSDLLYERDAMKRMQSTESCNKADQLQLALHGCSIENGKLEETESICQRKLVAAENLLKEKDEALDKGKLFLILNKFKHIESKYQKLKSAESDKNAENDERSSIEQRVVDFKESVNAKTEDLKSQLNQCKSDLEESSKTVIKIKENQDICEKNKNKLKEQIKVTTEAFYNSFKTSIKEFPKLQNLIMEKTGIDIYELFPT